MTNQIQIDHQLKTNPTTFKDVLDNRKKAELRKDDRDFKVDQIIQLNEFDGQQLTASYILIKITHILDDPAYIPNGLVMLSFEIIYWVLVDHAIGSDWSQTTINRGE